MLKCATALFFISGALLAHPFPTEELGRFSELFIYPDRVDVRYTLTLTRLLAIEEIAIMNRDGDNRISEEERSAYFRELQRTLLAGLELRLDGKRLPLSPKGEVQIKPPAYRVMHFEASFPRIGGGTHTIYYRDDNYPGILGPVEITAFAGEGIDLGDFENVDFSKKYAELREKPYEVKDYMDAMQMRELELRFWLKGERVQVARGTPAEKPPSKAVRKPPEKEPSLIVKLWKKSARKMEETADRLFTGENVGIRFTIFAFIAFFFFGAVHALTPGHGKTIAAAYLIGSRGRVVDALLLGIVVTATHTSSVIILGIVVKLLKDVFLPQRLGPWIASLSGAIILFMGFYLLLKRVAMMARTGEALPHTHGHHHEHDEGHHHDEHHDHAEGVRGGDILSLGIAGGMVPCPEAFAVLLAAINWNRTLLGIALILVFSLGLALVLIAIGVLIVYGRLAIGEGKPGSRLVSCYLPIGSAVVIMLLGIGLTVAPLMRAGIIVINL